MGRFFGPSPVSEWHGDPLHPAGAPAAALRLANSGAALGAQAGAERDVGLSKGVFSSFFGWKMGNFVEFISQKKVLPIYKLHLRSDYGSEKPSKKLSFMNIFPVKLTFFLGLRVKWQFSLVFSVVSNRQGQLWPSWAANMLRCCRPWSVP